MAFLKEGKTNWKYILIVVILAFFVGGGILGYCWWVGKEKVEVPGVRVPEKVVEDETADWSGYTGNGVTLRFPQDWKIIIAETINLTPKEKRIPEDIWVYVGVSEKEDLQAQPFYNPINFFGKPQPSPEKIKINEKEFYKSEERFEAIRSIKYAIANKDESRIGWITLSIRHGRQKMDYYLPDSEIVPELKIFNLILSTFKFTEMAEITDWKTYRNEEYGFEVKYPPDWDYLPVEDYLTIPIDPSTRTSLTIIFGHSRFFGEIEGQKKVQADESLIYLYIWPHPEPMPEEPMHEWMRTYYMEYTLHQADITVSERRGKLMEFNEPDLPEGIFFAHFYAYWKKNPEDFYLYELKARVSYHYPEQREIFNQILSTFRFLE